MQDCQSDDLLAAGTVERRSPSLDSVEETHTDIDALPTVPDESVWVRLRKNGGQLTLLRQDWEREKGPVYG